MRAPLKKSFFDRPEQTGASLAVLFGDGDNDAEFLELAFSAGANIIRRFHARRPRRINPSLYLHKGGCEALKSAVSESGAGQVLFDAEISAVQERRLEEFLNCAVVDRTRLILDIFARHARSHAGKMQVEIAQLQYLSTRLVGGWTHLERQRGGIGLRGGPGEAQLEADRRQVKTRLATVRKRLEKVCRQRALGRRARNRAHVPVVVLVGRTNAGKSRLFHRLSGSPTYVKKQMFATLDPLLRRVRLPGGRMFVLADTVGFIRDLPSSLLDAFHATLEEISEASLLLHVCDASREDRREDIREVDGILRQIGCAELPQIRVFNKIDLLRGVSPHVYHNTGGMTEVWLSAATGGGAKLLLRAMERVFFDRMGDRLSLPPGTFANELERPHR